MENNTNSDAYFSGVSNEDSDLESVSDFGDNETDTDISNDPEFDVMKAARKKEIEEEIEKLKAMQSEVERNRNSSSSRKFIKRSMSLSYVPTAAVNVSDEKKTDADARSVYIGNVDYSATAEELESHFHGCGSINRVTILCDKYTGHPKGFAYVEFAEKESIIAATALDDSLFKGRQIKVNAKRTNLPGISSTNRPPRGRGGTRGRGGFGSFSSGYTGGYGSFSSGYTGGYGQYASGPYSRPYRGRGASSSRRGYYYSPY